MNLSIILEINFPTSYSLSLLALKMYNTPSANFRSICAYCLHPFKRIFDKKDWVDPHRREIQKFQSIASIQSRSIHPKKMQLTFWLQQRKYTSCSVFHCFHHYNVKIVVAKLHTISLFYQRSCLPRNINSMNENWINTLAQHNIFSIHSFTPKNVINFVYSFSFLLFL